MTASFQLLDTTRPNRAVTTAVRFVMSNRYITCAETITHAQLITSFEDAVDEFACARFERRAKHLLGRAFFDDSASLHEHDV